MFDTIQMCIRFVGLLYLYHINHSYCDSTKQADSSDTYFDSNIDNVCHESIPPTTFAPFFIDIGNIYDTTRTSKLISWNMNRD